MNSENEKLFFFFCCLTMLFVYPVVFIYFNSWRKKYFPIVLDKDKSKIPYIYKAKISYLYMSMNYSFSFGFLPIAYLYLNQDNILVTFFNRGLVVNNFEKIKIEKFFNIWGLSKVKLQLEKESMEICIKKKDAEFIKNWIEQRRV